MVPTALLELVQLFNYFLGVVGWLSIFQQQKAKISCLNPRENKSRYLFLDNQPTLSSYDDGVTFFFF